MGWAILRTGMRFGKACLDLAVLYATAALWNSCNSIVQLVVPMDHLVLIGFCVFVLGAAGGVLDFWYQVRAVDLSLEGDRSSAMASTGLGWNVSAALAPLLVGWLAESHGFRFAFLGHRGIFLPPRRRNY
jgi:hypothetical protein